MTLTVTLVSKSDEIIRLVRDFAHGMGCQVHTSSAASPHTVRIDVDDEDHSLVELLTHVALSAAKTGIDLTEPLCQIMYRHAGVTSDVTLTLRIADFRIHTEARTTT